MHREKSLVTSMRCVLLGAVLLAFIGLVHAGGPHYGPFGIDHRVTYDNDGIIQRDAQLAVEYLSVVTVIGGSLWLGGEERLGKTYWKAFDAVTAGAISSTVLKEATTRSRPMQSDDPNLWLQGKAHYSFPSGEVTAVTASVVPFMLEYGPEHPGIFALAALPLYDAVARVKVHGHWQSDVVAGAVLGFGTGYLAHQQDNPFILNALPKGFEVGFRKRF